LEPVQVVSVAGFIPAKLKSCALCPDPLDLYAGLLNPSDEVELQSIIKGFT